MRKVDRKTLEYLEERAKKARKIISNINELKSSIGILSKRVVNEILFYGFEDNVNIKVKKIEFLEEMVPTYIALAEKEIQRLEQELADL